MRGTYGLLQLTDVVHQAEERYDAIRQGKQEWDTELLQTELQQTADVVAQYAHINEVTLGRKGPGRRGSVDKFLMVPKKS